MRSLNVAAAAGLALAASSVSLADIIYTVEREYVGGVLQTAPANNRVDGFVRSGGFVTNIVTANQVHAAILAQNPASPILLSDIRLADIAPGAGGEFLLTQGQAHGRPVGSNPSQGAGALLRLQGVTGVPSVVAVTSGNNLSNPIGVSFDPTTNNGIMVLNPGTDGTLSPYYDGIVGANLGTGVQTQIASEPGGSNPRYQAGAYIQRDPSGAARSFVVGSIQGGLNSPAGATQGGPQLYRLTYDAALGGGSLTRIIDFSNTAATGLGEDFVDGSDFFGNGGIRGIAVVPGQTQSVYVAMRFYGIYRVDLDAGGNYLSMTQILSVTDPASPIFGAALEALDYDPFANKLVFSADGISAAFNATIPGLWEMNLNGTGANRLVPDVLVRGIDFVEVIPGPGSAGLIALAGLVAARRRRG